MGLVHIFNHLYNKKLSWKTKILRYSLGLLHSLVLDWTNFNFNMWLCFCWLSTSNSSVHFPINPHCFSTWFFFHSHKVSDKSLLFISTIRLKFLPNNNKCIFGLNFNHTKVFIWVEVKRLNWLIFQMSSVSTKVYYRVLSNKKLYCLYRCIISVLAEMYNQSD